jgi:hypothetical protein
MIDRKIGQRSKCMRKENGGKEYKAGKAVFLL